MRTTTMFSHKFLCFWSALLASCCQGREFLGGVDVMPVANSIVEYKMAASPHLFAIIASFAVLLGSIGFLLPTSSEGFGPPKDVVDVNLFVDWSDIAPRPFEDFDVEVHLSHGLMHASAFVLNDTQWKYEGVFDDDKLVEAGFPSGSSLAQKVALVTSALDGDNTLRSEARGVDEGKGFLFKIEHTLEDALGFDFHYELRLERVALSPCEVEYRQLMQQNSDGRNAQTARALRILGSAETDKS